MRDRELSDVLGDRGDDNLRQRDRPVRCARLRWRQERWPAGEEYELLIHPYRPTKEVDLAQDQAEALALTHASPRSQDHESPESGRHGACDRLDRLC